MHNELYRDVGLTHRLPIGDDDMRIVNQFRAAA